MEHEQENFESLRQMLALKRYEQPPPGYFNNFSRQVIAKIQAMAVSHQDPLLQRLFLQFPWLERVWDTFRMKPALAGAFGVSLCAVLVAGVVYSETPSGEQNVALPVAQVQPPMPPIADQALAVTASGQSSSVVAGSAAAAVSTEPQGSLFQQFQQLKQNQRPWVVPASFGQ